MDGSISRMGQPCWYKLPDVQMSAINDGLLIEAAVYQILKDHFSHLDCYTKLIEHFHDFTFSIALGQFLDVKAMREDVLTFTIEKYKAILKHKACQSFYMAIAPALLLAGYTNPEAFSQAKTILFELGYFGQVQNDFMDCFGDPNVLGKIGTDIQEGKCTWLAVMCLQRATAAQKGILKECYGKNDPECIRRVKQLYKELSLPNLYAIYEEDSYNNIRMLIEKTAECSVIPAEVYLEMLKFLWKE
uniref:Farnesyl pyrophosphate synthase n=1 Tax=Phlebotomus papatasi TaxID=29031 RepID=A0A1B0D8P6_PHLPP